MDSIPEPFDPSPAPPVTPPSAPFTVRKVFLGPYGLRAGWGLLIYIVLFLATQTGVNAAIHHVRHRHDNPAASAKPKPAPAKPAAMQPQDVKPLVIGEGIGFAALLFLGWLMAVIERRRIGAYGLGGRHFLHRFFHGAFWGLAALSLIVLLLHTFHLLTFDTMLDHGLPVIVTRDDFQPRLTPPQPPTTRPGCSAP